MTRWMVICILMIGAVFSAYAQEPLYELGLYGTFTTSSKLFHHPNDPNELLRDEYLPIDGIFSGGIDVRRMIEPIHLQLGLGIEYIRKVTSEDNVAGNGAVVTDRNGYEVIPIEASAYFYIPIGTKDLKFYMGGGGGMYLGRRIYWIGNAEAATVSTQPGFGIHVLSGVDYMFSSRWSVRGELKFRNVQFRSTNQFSSSTTYSNGSLVTLDQQPQDSRINVDGMVINAGIAFHF